MLETLRGVSLRGKSSRAPRQGMKTTRFNNTGWVLVVALGALSLGCSDEDDDVTSDTLGEQPAATPEPEPAKIGPWGFDLPGMDASVAPGDSFYAYAIGGWQAT